MFASALRSYGRRAGRVLVLQVGQVLLPDLPDLVGQVLLPDLPDLPDLRGVRTRGPSRRLLRRSLSLPGWSSDKSGAWVSY